MQAHKNNPAKNKDLEQKVLELYNRIEQNRRQIMHQQMIIQKEITKYNHLKNIVSK